MSAIFNVTAQREPPISATDHHYSIQLGTGAYFVQNSQRYYIQNIFGFALLSDGGTLNSDPDPASPQNGDWVYAEQLNDNNPQPNNDYMSGFFEDQNHATNSLLPGQPKLTFDFSANLDDATPPFDAYGIHASWSTSGTSANPATGFLRFNADGSTTIQGVTPEPAFYQLAGLLGLGAIGLLRLRRPARRLAA